MTLTIPRWVRRAAGHRFDNRYSWGELVVYRPRFDFSLRLTDRHSDPGDMLIVHLVVFSLYLFLPTRLLARVPVENGTSRMDRDVTFGFYTIDTSVVWRWRQGYWSFDWPWFSLKHYSTEVLTLEGKPYHIELASLRRQMDFTTSWKASEAAKEANCAVYPYRYRLRNGTIQERTAKVTVSRMTWTRKWFPWVKWVRTSIDVQFNAEVGERTGSWKGGCTGCGYDMLPGETPVGCLRRMERERVFN